MKQNIFIGGAWPYANSSMHIGHIAALLPGDIIARYYRKNNANVLYVSGTDSHGTPVLLRSLTEKSNPKDVSQKYHLQIKECFQKLNFSYDIYSSTSENFHFNEVNNLLRRIELNGFMFDRIDIQEFCEHCNKFLSDREIIGKCPICGGYAKGDQCEICSTIFNSSHLKDKHCKYCNSDVSFKATKKIYWEQSYFRNNILQYIESNKSNWKRTVLDRTLQNFRLETEDRVISRNLSYGINLPFDTFHNQTIYVWIDALLGYITAGRKFCQDNNINWEDFYKDSSNLKTYFVHGKDNIPFHSIMYPSILLSLDDNYHLPDYFVSSDYLFVNNEKISKTKGNGVMAKDLLDKYDADSIRFYMACKAPESEISHFTFSDFEDCHNKYLVNSYSYLVNQISDVLLKGSNEYIYYDKCNEKIEKRIRITYSEVGEMIEKGEIRSAIHKIKDLMTFSSDFFKNISSWISTDYDLDPIKETQYTCLILLINLANMLDPFIPKSSEKIFSAFGLKELKWEYIKVKDFKKLSELPILFKTIK